MPASDPASTASYTLTYNDDGQVSTVTEPFNTSAVPLSLTFGYDGAGNRTLVTDSQGGQTSSVYDDADRLTSRVVSGSGLDTLGISLGYDGDGNLSQVTRTDNGTLVGTTSETYEAGEVTSITNTYGSGTSPDLYSYLYDPAGQVSSQIDNGQTTAYSYDATGQLLSAGTQTYSFDAEGNQATYNVGPDNEVISDGTWSYTYDADGNETSKTDASGDKWTYGYDNLDRLISASVGSGTTVVTVYTYKYDMFGNRIETDVLNVGPDTTIKTEYAYDGWNPAKMGGTGTTAYDVWWSDQLGSGSSLTTRYVDGDAVDQVFARVDSVHGAAWLDTDHLGSVRVVTDGSGNVIAQVTYDAFGNVVSKTESYAGASGMYGWTGRVEDLTTGLQYNRDRYYDPQTGRWISQDPMGFDAGDSNLYRYVNNRPTEATDPSGEDLFALNYTAAEDAQKTLASYGLVGLARSNARNSACSCYAGMESFVSLEADHAWSKSATA